MGIVIKDGSLLMDLSELEEALYAKRYNALCGVDEVGRGPLAGPVVAAAIIVPRQVNIEGLDDSKCLTPLRRERIFETVVELELDCAVGIIDPETIDRINILKASLMAMRKAVMSLKHSPDFVLVDGNYPVPNLTQPQYAVVKGDSRCKCIAAASVVAKVTRDRIMDKYQAIYPSYSFAQHKGYPTPDHLRELKEHGPCEIHRRTFKPVADIINQYALF